MNKFDKKKQREKEVRKKILLRREKIREKAKEIDLQRKEEKETQSKKRPIKNAEFYHHKKVRDIEIRWQLEHNMKILEALNEDYEKELKERKEYAEEIKQNQSLTAKAEATLIAKTGFSEIPQK